MILRIFRRILQLVLSKPAFFPPPKDGKLRLNLGCGDKKLEGYINIDCSSSRLKIKPDLVCDVRKLPYHDNAVEEIITIHTIEHFYQWEIEALLSEWRRVLRPGGKLIIECPNMLYAIRRLFLGFNNFGTGKEAQDTMWVLYGDPSWKDPLMCHRWGYTPKTLQQLLIKNFFVGVKKEKAIFKKREPRDMRMVCYKKRLND